MLILKQPGRLHWTRRLLLLLFSDAINSRVNGRCRAKAFSPGCQVSKEIFPILPCGRAAAAAQGWNLGFVKRNILLVTHTLTAAGWGLRNISKELNDRCHFQLLTGRRVAGGILILPKWKWDFCRPWIVSIHVQIWKYICDDTIFILFRKSRCFCCPIPLFCKQRSFSRLVHFWRR